MASANVPVAQAAAVPLGPGDIMPTMALTDMAGAAVDLNADDLSGNYIVLVLQRDSRAVNAQLSAFETKRARVDAVGAKLFVVLPADVPPAGDEVMAAATALRDQSGALFAAFGAGPGHDSVTILIAPNQHIALVAHDTDPDHADRVLDLIDGRAEARRTRQLEMHPPVLLVPDVLSPEDCQKLISIYRFQGNEFVESGHNVVQGRTSDCKMKIDDYGRVDRIDHWVVTSDTNAFIDQRLRARLFPEIKKAFQYPITRREHYRIACYEGERGGEPHGHRDDTASIVAHRRFAVTINLNTENYEGGELRFPEFGDQRYRPPTGAAIVFSCSLLHEVMHVVSGRRFALLAFLFGDS